MTSPNPSVFQDFLKKILAWLILRDLKFLLLLHFPVKFGVKCKLDNEIGRDFLRFLRFFYFWTFCDVKNSHSLNIITRKPDDMFNKKLLIGEKRMKIAFCEHFCKTNIFPRILPILNFKFTFFTKFLKGTQRLSPFRVSQRSGKTKNKLKFQVGLN